MNLKNKVPALSILLAGGLWGLTGLFVRTLNASGFNNIDLLFFRSVVTALALTIYLLLTDKSKLKIRIRDWWCFFGTGIVSFLTFGFFYFYTISHASMSVAAILLYTSPFFVMIMAAAFFKEKITPLKISALLLASIGCFLICGTDNNITLTPLVIFTGVMSGLCYALYSIFGRVALKKYDSLTVTSYTFIFAAVGSLFVVDIPDMLRTSIENPPAVLLAFAFAIVSAVLPYIFYTYGLAHTDTSKAAIMSTFEAVMASIVGIIAFGEKITVWGILGIVLVILAVVLLNPTARKK